MTSHDLSRNIAALCELPPGKKARCVLFAAETALSAYREWTIKCELPDLSNGYLRCFEQWLAGEALTSELSDATHELYAQLPKDLRLVDDPRSGFAGCALVDVGIVATEQALDVEESIVTTAVAYAAAVHCGIGKQAIWFDFDRLTPCEVRFFGQWWEQCEAAFPELARKAADPEWLPWWARMTPD